MTVHKTRLGARELTNEEIKHILPDVDSIYERIDTFRSELSKEKQEHVQKTNNIGIIGARGAGKTSVLRTIHKRLRDQNTNFKDIILPIIIPENMSTDVVLMDVILGMLKTVVDAKIEQIEKEETKQSLDCIQENKGKSLKKAYEKVIQQYCYIKEDYRHILIQQFTTEQYYIAKTQQVFNSDTEFINAFNRFLDELLKVQDNEEKQDALLFLFIDDIDLSTTRCIDVTKTLLSYLSNQRIVTFISGDENTFEEALTLDFLRQEHALDSTIFQEIYFGTDSNSEAQLLQRKKRLAYEYLKKIIPPAYRYQVKYWSLNERGKYTIADENGNTQDNLSQLLMAVLSGKNSIFNFSYNTKSKEFFCPVLFNLFDNTSRGLNNVYNTLIGILQEKDRSLITYKKLLEVIITSNPDLVGYKNDLFINVIEITEDNAKIDYDNAERLINNMGEGQKKYSFHIFLFIEFARQLLQIPLEREEAYKRLLMNTLVLYLNDESYDGKIRQENNNQFDQFVISDDKKNVKDWKEFTEVEQKCLIAFLKKSDFLFSIYLILYLTRKEFRKILAGKGEVINLLYAFAMAVESIPDEGASNRREDYLADMFRMLKTEFGILLQHMSENEMLIYGIQILNNLKIAFKPYGMAYIREDYYEDDIVPYKENMDNYFFELEKYNAKDYEQCLYAYYIYALRCCFAEVVEKKTEKKFFRWFDEPTVIWRGITSGIMQEFKDIFSDYNVKPLVEISYGNKKKEYQVIEYIDQLNLWKQNYSRDTIKKYLENKLTDYLYEIAHNRVFWDLSGFTDTDVYKEFYKCPDGSSRTLVRILKDNIESILGIFGDKDKIDYVDITYIIMLKELLQSFLTHDRALYGRMEARKLLMYLQDLPVVLFEDKEFRKEIEYAYNNKVDELIEERPNFNKKEEVEAASKQLLDLDKNKFVYDKKEFKFIFHSYLRCLQENHADFKKQSEIAKVISDFTPELLQSEINAGKKEITEVYDIISQHMDITEGEFTQLFNKG